VLVRHLIECASSRSDPEGKGEIVDLAGSMGSKDPLVSTDRTGELGELHDLI